MSLLSELILTTDLTLSLSGCLSLSLSWQKFIFDDLKGRPFLPLFKYFRVWFHWETQTPLHPFSLSAVALPWCGKWTPRMHWNIYVGLFLLQGEFASFSSYYISDATLCKFTQINNSLIEINPVKIEPYGPSRLLLKIYGTIYGWLTLWEVESDQWGAERCMIL